jgi:hypothetical protein
MEDDEVVRRLIRVMDKYDRQYPYYDEVFWQAHERIRECGEASKLDLAALFFWKRPGGLVGPLSCSPSRGQKPFR